MTNDLDIGAFLAYLRAHAPEVSCNYVDGPFLTIEDDLSSGPAGIALDGWWFADDLEAAILAAIREAPEPRAPRERDQEATR